MPEEFILLAILLVLFIVFAYVKLNNSKWWPKMLSKIRFRNDVVPENKPEFVEEIKKENNV